MGRACGMYVEKRYAYRILVEKPEGKKPLGRPGHSWENNVDMNLIEAAWKGVD
jgi:hypothetical protein